MIRRPPRSTPLYSSAASDVYKRQALAGATPLLAVYPGRLQAPALGVALQAWDDDGHPVVGREGELVVTKPMPSMPLYFLNDHDGSRYHDSYFNTYPGVWRHGDWIT